jgi:toxin ParE1/3/4
MAYRLARAARDDLDEIADYILRQSGNVTLAERALNVIARRFELLAERPRIGRTREDLKPGVRSLPTLSYVIVYRIVGTIAHPQPFDELRLRVQPSGLRVCRHESLLQLGSSSART